MKFSRRRKREHSVSHERWLVSYADLLTLLFALFVVMYAMSRADRGKFEAVAQGMKEAFSGAPARPGGPVFPGEGTSPANKDEAVPSSRQDQSSASGSQQESRSEVGEFSQMRADLAEQLEVSALADKVIVDEDSRGLIIKLAAKDFFAPGESTVRLDMQPLFDRICRVISSTHHFVRIEGHTDLSEAELNSQPGGWELASARATRVVQHLIRRFDMDPARLSAVSYSHFRPIADGDDELSRGKNRRVEIVVVSERGDG